MAEVSPDVVIQDPAPESGPIDAQSEPEAPPAPAPEPEEAPASEESTNGNGNGHEAEHKEEAADSPVESEPVVEGESPASPAATTPTTKPSSLVKKSPAAAPGTAKVPLRKPVAGAPASASSTRAPLQTSMPASSRPTASGTTTSGTVRPTHAPRASISGTGGLPKPPLASSVRAAKSSAPVPAVGGIRATRPPPAASTASPAKAAGRDPPRLEERHERLSGSFFPTLALGGQEDGYDDPSPSDDNDEDRPTLDRDDDWIRRSQSCCEQEERRRECFQGRYSLLFKGLVLPADPLPGHRQLATTAASLSAAESSLSTAQAAISTHEASLATLQSSLTESETSLASKTTELSTAQESLHASQESLSLAATELASAQASIATLTEEKASLTATVSELQAKITDLEADLEKAKLASTTDASALEEARELHASHSVELQKALEKHAQHEQAVKELKEAHAVELGSAREGTQKEIDGRVADVQAEGAVELSNAIAELNAVHETGFGELVKKHNAAADAVAGEKKVLEEKIASLEAALATAQSQTSDLEHANQDVDAKIASEKALVIEEYEAKIQALAKERDTVETAAQAELVALKAQLAAIAATHAEEVAAVHAGQAAAIQAAKDAALHEAGESHRSDLAELREETNGTTQQLRSVHLTELEALKSAHAAESGAALAELTSQVASLRVELDATAGDLAKSKAHEASLATELATSTSQLAEAKEALSTASATPITPDADVEALKERIQALEASHGKTQTELTSAQEAAQHSKVSAAQEIDTMQQMHDQYLKEKEEEHVVALGRVRKDLDKSTQAHADEVKDLKEKLLLAEEAAEKAAKVSPAPVATPAPAPASEDIADLHAAHSAKLSEVEAASKDRIAALEMELAQTKHELELYRSDDQ
ncbi:hypothetical protein RQP46_006798 [Phenoliferia psychrophenolica]